MASKAMMIVEDEKPALALEIPKEQSFDDWCAMGRALAGSERVLGWYIGDWWEARKPEWGKPAETAAENIWGVAYSTLRSYGSVARRFKGDTRISELSFKHHRHVVDLPHNEAQEMLSQAVSCGLSAADFRVAAMKRKVALGIFVPRVDDDPSYTALKKIAAAWNSAPVDARETFAEMIEETGTGVIEV